MLLNPWKCSRNGGKGQELRLMGPVPERRISASQNYRCLRTWNVRAAGKNFGKFLVESRCGAGQVAGG
jgi:hypothetical protein